MEYSKVKPILNGLWIIGALIALYFFWLGGNYAYKDTGEDYIDVYPNGNVAVETIEGVETEGDPIRVIIDKTYNGVSLSLYGEKEESVGEFSFFHDTGRSYDINYEEYDGNLYLDRTLQYVAGYNTISIGLLCIVIICGIDLITHLLSIGEDKKNSSESQVIKVGFYKHINNAISNSRLAIVALLGLLLMVAYFFDQVVIFIYSRSDIELLQGFWLFVLVISVIAFTNDFLNNSIEFNFKEDILTVTKRNKVLFEENIDNIIYEEIIVRDSNTTFFKAYQTLQLRLRNNNVQSEGVNLNLMSFGYDKFKEITNKLENHANQSIIHESDYVEDKTGCFNLSVRDYSNTRKSFTSKIIVAVVVLIAVILVSMWLELDFMISVFVFLIALIYLLISLIVLIAKKSELTSFMVLDDSVKVGSDVIKSTDIFEVTMSDPSEVGPFRKKIVFQTVSGKRAWHLEPKSRLKNQEKDVQYQLLFNELKTRYRNVFRVV